MSIAGDGQLVFDNHNIVYAYGDLDRYEAKLAAAGFQPGPVGIPAPHAHNYHPELDRFEAEAMDYWAWKRFPLDPDDEP